MSNTVLGSLIDDDRISSLELALEEMTLDRDYWQERATGDWDRREFAAGERDKESK